MFSTPHEGDVVLLDYFSEEAAKVTIRGAGKGLIKRGGL